MKLTYAILLTVTLIFSSLFNNFIYAGENDIPVNITYLKKAKSFLGKHYTIYKVHCSNGSKRQISFWESRKKKPWCLDQNDKTCRNNQLDIAVLACQK